MKSVLVTGSRGFIGKNLVSSLALDADLKIYEFNNGDDLDVLKKILSQVDFIFHLAGVNRPETPEGFVKGNSDLTRHLINVLLELKKSTPLVFSSSTQAILDNPYGESKKNAEEYILNYSTKSGAPVFIYRLPNVFGKWSKPNYNSVIATFCHNVARDLPIKINDENVVLNLVYIDDVVNSFISNLKEEKQNSFTYFDVPIKYSAKLGEIASIIKSFKDTRSNFSIPDMSNSLISRLHSTYLSFLPKDQFKYPLKMNVDHRGSFTEFIRTIDRGQVSVNISKPGVTKGNHWHHSKHEKFLVVSGEGEILFRLLDGNEVITYRVSGECLEVVDIPPGYTHNITNVGSTEMVTIMWANEPYIANAPDTYFLPV